MDEAKAHSPYGIVVHSDKAENLDKVLFSELYPDILAPTETEPIVRKRGFFAKTIWKIKQLTLGPQLFFLYHKCFTGA